MQNKFNQKLNQAITNQTSFLLLRKPNTTQLELWLNEEEGDYFFYFNRFDNSNEIVFRTKDITTSSINEFNSLLNLNLKSTNQQEEISKEDYIKLLNKTIKKLNESDTKKIVISRIKELNNEGIDLTKTIKNLHKHYPNAYVYLWYTTQKEVWIGASPELLLTEENLTLQTVSLAGTLPKNEEWTSKEYKEQQVVTDYIVNQLQPAKNITIDGPHTIDAGFFNHLKSYISAQVSDYSEVYPILKKLHPTPAVCGLPKENAQQFILANEGYDRSFYTGYLGYKTPTSSLYFVNLRCAKIYQNKIKIYVGGGIMPDSNPEKEWQETEMKSKTIGHLIVNH